MRSEQWAMIETFLNDDIAIGVGEKHEGDETYILPPIVVSLVVE